MLSTRDPKFEVTYYVGYSATDPTSNLCGVCGISGRLTLSETSYDSARLFG